MVRWNVWLRKTQVFICTCQDSLVSCFPWETLRRGFPVFIASAVFQLTSGVWNSSQRFGCKLTCISTLPISVNSSIKQNSIMDMVIRSVELLQRLITDQGVAFDNKLTFATLTASFINYLKCSDLLLETLEFFEASTLWKYYSIAR